MCALSLLCSPVLVPHRSGGDVPSEVTEKTALMHWVFWTGEPAMTAVVSG